MERKHRRRQDPTKPKWEGYVGARRNSSSEDVVVRRIGTRDMLGIGVQTCGPGGSDGLALFDVTDPREPVELSFLPTPTGVHELDMVVRADGEALALLATPFTEFFDTYFGTSFCREFRIVDISDPANPQPLDLRRAYGANPVELGVRRLPVMDPRQPVERDPRQRMAADGEHPPVQLAHERLGEQGRLDHGEIARPDADRVADKDGRQPLEPRVRHAPSPALRGSDPHAR